MEPDMSLKKNFLVVYDYGMGGLWAVVSARSESDILCRFPQLRVIHSRPGWMNDVEYAKIVSQTSFDIDADPPQGWLAQI
jgi:hypothetical protein